MADGMTHRKLAKAVRKAAPTPLLQFLAGPHAESIADLWSAPHTAFFTLPAARRHAAAVLIARGFIDGETIVRLVERARDREVAARLAHGDGTAGLMKAFAAMGETLWRADDYERFLQLFAGARSNRTLRHMSDIRPAQLAVIHALPAGLREARVVASVPSLQAARDLGLAIDLAERINGVAARDALIVRLRKARTTQSLFQKAAEGLQPEVFTGATPAPILGAMFTPVTNRAALEKTAQQFQNCLRDFASDLMVGRMAVFVWQGPPAAPLALRWDPAGWRLAEAEGHANTPLPDEALQQLVAGVAEAGVRTGPSTWTLTYRLGRHPHGDCDPIADTWRDRLELGQLWD